MKERCEWNRFRDQCDSASLPISNGARLFRFRKSIMGFLYIFGNDISILFKVISLNKVNKKKKNGGRNEVDRGRDWYVCKGRQRRRRIAVVFFVKKEKRDKVFRQVEREQWYRTNVCVCVYACEKGKKRMDKVRVWKRANFSVRETKNALNLRERVRKWESERMRESEKGKERTKTRERNACKRERKSDGKVIFNYSYQKKEKYCRASEKIHWRPNVTREINGKWKDVLRKKRKTIN